MKMDDEKYQNHLGVAISIALRMGSEKVTRLSCRAPSRMLEACRLV